MNNYKKTIIIHIGPHKTGSTSIQYFLSNNSSKLQYAGFLFPRTGLYDDTNHAELSWALKDDNSIDKFNYIYDHLLNEIYNSKCKNIIISSEEFSDLSVDQVVRLQEKLSNYSVKIILFARKQDELLRSIFFELLKQGEYYSSFLDFVCCSAFEAGAFSLRKFDYSVLADIWTNAFGFDNLIIIPFEPYKKCLVQSFLKYSGIPFFDNLKDELPWLNKTPNQTVVNALLFVNRILTLSRVSADRHRQISYDAYEVAVERYKNDDDKVFQCLSLYSARIIQDYYAESNLCFSKIFMKGHINALRFEFKNMASDSLCYLEPSEIRYWTSRILDDLDFESDKIIKSL